MTSNEEDANVGHPDLAVVTGAFGYTGGYVARRLIDECVRVGDPEPSTGRAESSWRTVGDGSAGLLRPVKAVMILSLMGILAACGIEPAPLPTREAEHISASELAEMVAESLAGVGLDAPDDGEDGLRLYSRSSLLLLLGTVDSDSPNQVYDALKDSPGIWVVVLVNVPGSADDEANLKLGRTLRQAGMSTYLPARGLVSSGGVDLLLSGARRIVERGAMVGVHSWADSDGSSGDAIPRKHPHHRLYLEYYQEMGVTQEFYWFTLGAAPPEGMHWMTEAEMERYEIFTELQ